MNCKLWIDKMPEDCYDCPCYDEEWLMCNLTEKDIECGEPDDCPLKLISDYGRKEK